MCTPSGRATGFSWTSASSGGVPHALVAGDVRVVPVGLPVVVEVGRRRPAMTWVAKRSSAQARAARCWDCEAELVAVGAGDAPLVGDALGALELGRELVVARSRLAGRAGRGQALAGVRPDRDAAHRLDPAGRRRRRPRPAPTSDVARLVACWDEPHCVSTVVAATSAAGRRVSQAVRVDVEGLLADLADAAADDLADLGRVDAGALGTAPSGPAASRSTGWMVDRPPPRRPTGVRTASTMTTSLMVDSVVVGLLVGRCRLTDAPAPRGRRPVA